MKIFKNILVGIDYSKASEMALKQAAYISQEEDSTLIALHVVVPLEIEDYQKFYSIPEAVMVESFRSRIKNIVEKQLGSRDAARAEVLIDVPYHGLIHFAESNKCDLIVPGSRGDNSDDLPARPRRRQSEPSHHFLSNEIKGRPSRCRTQWPHRSAIKQFLIGSFAERLVHRSPCSVVTVPVQQRNNTISTMNPAETEHFRTLLENERDAVADEIEGTQ